MLIDEDVGGNGGYRDMSGGLRRPYFDQRFFALRALPNGIGLESAFEKRRRRQVTR